MNVMERVADRLPHRFVRPTSAASLLAALVGCACLFAAVVFGSIAWAIGGLAALTIAAALWHLAAIASEVRRLS